MFTPKHFVFIFFGLLFFHFHHIASFLVFFYFILHAVGWVCVCACVTQDCQHCQQWIVGIAMWIWGASASTHTVQQISNINISEYVHINCFYWVETTMDKYYYRYDHHSFNGAEEPGQTHTHTQLRCWCMRKENREKSNRLSQTVMRKA